MSDPRPDLLSALPGLVVTAVHAMLPGLAQCKTMTGRLDLATLGQISAQAPAVLISRLGIRTSRPYAGTQWHYAIRMAAFVLTKDRLNLERDIAAASIVQALMERIPGATWGEAGVGPAESVVEEPLVSSKIRASGVAISAVVWEQPVVLRGWPVTAPIPIEVYAGWEPRIGAVHEGDYHAIGSAGE